MSAESLSPGEMDAVRRQIESLSPAKRALLEQQLRARAGTGSATIQRRRDTSPPPASFAQELLWELDRAAPDSYAYNVVRATRLTGALDRDALQRSLDALVERHEALRTTFANGAGAPVQIAAAPSPVAIEVVDLSRLGSDERERVVEDTLTQRARASFDLARDAQFRVTLIELGPTEHILLWAMHHVTMDGWSASIALREWGELYDAACRGSAAALAILPITYGDFAAWQRDSLTGAALDRLLGYWRDRLSGAPELLELPTDFPRPLAQRFDGGQHSIVIPPDVLARLRVVAHANDVTLYMVLVAAYVTLLHRLTGQDDIVIGSPVAARTHPELEHVVGYFANTLAYRNDLSGDPTFAALLGRVRETVLGALDHQNVPLEKLVLDLQAERRLSRAPLFQCVLTMEDATPPANRLGGLVAVPVELDFSHAGAAKFDLLLLARETGDTLRLMLQHRADLFTDATAARIIERLRVMLDAIASDPSIRVSQIPWLPDAERGSIGSWAFADAGRPYVRAVHESFAMMAARKPHAPAIVAQDASLTYGETDARANRLAHQLRASGVARGDMVGIALERSADAIVAILAVMKAGAGYVPITADVPAVRVAAQLRDGAARVVITRADAPHVANLPSDVVTVRLDADAASIEMQPRVAPEATVTPDDAAYVLFTSGSTGVPKGVVVTHGNLAHYVDAISVRLSVDSGSPWRFGLVSSWGADLGHTALFPALASGGILHVLDAHAATEPATFAAYCAEHVLDVLKLTPSHWTALTAGLDAAELARVVPRQWLVFGGEALRWDVATRVLDSGTSARVLNHYGPTEATVGATTFEVTRDTANAARARGAQTVPIGRPLPGVATYIIDGAGERAAIGIPAELFLGGSGIARGYIARPELTAARFGSDRFASGGDGRVYRTGDRVRWLDDGSIEFVGRSDTQVKVRGYRVELGDIESALAAHDSVAQCAVVTTSGESGANAGSELALSAYVEPKRGMHIDMSTLSNWLAGRIPEYMMPATIVMRDSLPLTSNGKVDRKRLEAEARSGDAANGATNGAADPTRRAADGEGAHALVTPRTETERALVAIWTEVLKRESIGVTDNFLALGGHSLSAIRVLGKISKQFGTRLPLRTLFESPTIAELALMLPDREGASASDASPGGASPS